jgi:hypothetical protein
VDHRDADLVADVVDASQPHHADSREVVEGSFDVGNPQFAVAPEFGSPFESRPSQ